MDWSLSDSWQKRDGLWICGICLFIGPKDEGLKRIGLDADFVFWKELFTLLQIRTLGNVCFATYLKGKVIYKNDQSWYRYYFNIELL